MEDKGVCMYVCVCMRERERGVGIVGVFRCFKRERVREG